MIKPVVFLWVGFSKGDECIAENARITIHNDITPVFKSPKGWESWYRFQGRKVTVIVGSSFDNVTRAEALKIAAKYAAGRYRVVCIELN